MAIQAVITADIVNSTLLEPVMEKQLQKSLEEILSPYTSEFYRGDSFQVFLEDAAAALQLTLHCRATAISITQDEEKASGDIRMSIGIAKTEKPTETLGSAKGEAFILSGRNLDEMDKANERIRITTTNALANEGLQVIAAYCNAIFKDMTGKQAEVIAELLKGMQQQDVAAKLKKSKSTIHQHVSAARWNELEKLLEHYENIIKLIA